MSVAAVAAEPFRQWRRAAPALRDAAADRARRGAILIVPCSAIHTRYAAGGRKSPVNPRALLSTPPKWSASVGSPQPLARGLAAPYRLSPLRRPTVSREYTPSTHPVGYPVPLPGRRGGAGRSGLPARRAAALCRVVRTPTSQSRVLPGAPQQPGTNAAGRARLQLEPKPQPEDLPVAAERTQPGLRLPKPQDPPVSLVSPRSAKSGRLRQ